MNCVGSSPLARGLHVLPFHCYEGGGIIPARAGFTRDGRAQVSTVGDHPRSRGVYAKTGDFMRETFGSSPLARGLHRIFH
mgnify:CR=1 FL=1